MEIDLSHEAQIDFKLKMTKLNNMLYSERIKN